MEINIKRGGTVLSKKTNYIPVKEAANLVEVSEKFLRRCLKIGLADFKFEGEDLLVDVKSIKGFLTLKETAKILSVSPRTVRRYTKKEKGKKLKSHQFKKDFAYELTDVEEFIKKSVYEN